jgi:hypothetical protein
LAGLFFSVLWPWQPSSSQLPSFSPSLICIRRPALFSAGRFNDVELRIARNTNLLHAKNLSFL